MNAEDSQYLAERMKQAGFRCPYASLAGPLIGVFYPLPFENELANRFALNNSKLKDLWCSVYSADQCHEMEEDPRYVFLDPKLRHALGFGTHAVELALLESRPPPKQPQITRAELRRLSFCNSDDLPQTISLSGVALHWVGIGWCEEGPATGEEAAMVVEDAESGAP